MVTYVNGHLVWPAVLIKTTFIFHLHGNDWNDEIEK